MLEPQDILIPDDEGDELRTPDPELEGALVEIERRCSAAGIKTERNLTFQTALKSENSSSGAWVTLSRF
jgi:hypothetical protein